NNAVPPPAADLYLSPKKDLLWTGLPELVEYIIPHRDSMRPSFRPAGHRPHGPLMNPWRPTMNGARPYKSFFQAPSYETRPFLKSSAVKNPYRAPWVPTVNRKFTTDSTKNHTADMGRKGKAVKPSACWTWNPSQELSHKGQFPEQH
nr:hypothetical protein [Tanacetum cinerariifolium]